MRKGKNQSCFISQDVFFAFVPQSQNVFNDQHHCLSVALLGPAKKTATNFPFLCLDSGSLANFPFLFLDWRSLEKNELESEKGKGK